MGKAKKAPKFAGMKKIVTQKAIKNYYMEQFLNPNKEKLPRNVPNVSSSLYFTYNTALGPPYRGLVDTNFINFSIQNKLVGLGEGNDGLLIRKMHFLYHGLRYGLKSWAKNICVVLRIAKDPRFERLPCAHKGTFADDCIVERVTQHKCFIVATCDRDLKRRIRKVSRCTNHVHHSAQVFN